MCDKVLGAQIFRLNTVLNELICDPKVRKRTFVYERPAKIQIRLRIRAVWSESSLDAFWIAKDAGRYFFPRGGSCMIEI